MPRNDRLLDGQRRHSVARRDLVTFALFALLIQVIVGPHLSLSSDGLTGEGNVVRQLGYIFVFALVLQASRVGHYPARLLAVPVGIVLALAWCWASVAWAIEPGIAVRRIALTTLVIWSIFMAVQQLGFKATVRILQQFTLLALIASYAVVAIWPSFGIHQFVDIDDLGLVGTWKGVLSHKNQAGPLCAFTIIIYFFGAEETRRPWRLLVIAAAAFFLYETGSKTSIGILLIALFAGWGFTHYRLRHRWWVIVALILVAAAASLVAAEYWQELTAPLNDEEALTGRVQIWPALFAFVQDHWLLGTGYGSFWNIGSASPIYQYTEAGLWVEFLASGHNGYLDMATQIGVPGLLLVVLGMIILPFGELLRHPKDHPQQGAMLMSLLVFCAGHNATESTLFDRDFLVQVFLVLTLALIYLDPAGRRRERAIGHPGRRLAAAE